MTRSMEEKVKKTKIIVKAPTQERSRQTVATILDACSRLLISEGFYSITTDKIAKEAGVSIGSLYQFFGNKESVVQAVVKNLMEEDKRFITEKMKVIPPLPAEQRVRAMIEMAIETIRRNSDLRAKLTTIQYYVADASYVSDSIKFFQEVVRNNMPQIPGRDIDRVSYIVVNAFIGLTNTMAIDKPDAIHDAKVVEEISQLFFKYLDMSPMTLTTSGVSAVNQNKGDFI